MRRREAVVLQRAVRVERVPDGQPVELAAGTAAQITQALGSSFTLWVDGRLMRLRGADADAIGKVTPVLPTLAPDADLETVRAAVWQALKACYDPEIPVDIVELGLVYGCEVEPMGEAGFRVSIRLTLTAPGCGMGEALANEVCDRVLELSPVREATVDIVFDPPWDRSMMSEAARLTLGL